MLPILNPYVSRPRALPGGDGGQNQVNIGDVKDNQCGPALRFF